MIYKRHTKKLTVHRQVSRFHLSKANKICERDHLEIHVNGGFKWISNVFFTWKVNFPWTIFTKYVTFHKRFAIDNGNYLFYHIDSSTQYRRCISRSRNWELLVVRISLKAGSDGYKLFRIHKKLNRRRWNKNLTPKKWYNLFCTKCLCGGIIAS